ncbi:unnamed protein product [Linum tenue]|nr:unnamed protein product [Linum tenue]
MPGLSADQVRVDVEEDGRTLVVSRERKREKERDQGIRYVRMERRLGKYLKRFPMPENADVEKVAARYKDGVLTVTVVKKPPEEPKKLRTLKFKSRDGGGVGCVHYGAVWCCRRSFLRSEQEPPKFIKKITRQEQNGSVWVPAQDSDSFFLALPPAFFPSSRVFPQISGRFRDQDEELSIGQLFLLLRSIPIPRTEIHDVRVGQFGSGRLELPPQRVFTSGEMELSEDYTCVISHGPIPKTTHIFDDCIVDAYCGVFTLDPSVKEASDDFYPFESVIIIFF